MGGVDRVLGSGGRAGVILVAAGFALLTCLDAVVKSLLARYPFFQGVFLRFGAGVMIASLVVALVRPPVPLRASIKANLSRGLLGVGVSTLFFFSLTRLPLAEAMALSFLAPIMVAVFGGALLGEPLERRSVQGLLAGLAGMAVMIGPKLGADAFTGSLLGVAAALGAAVFYALNIVLLRSLAQRDNVVVIVAFQNLVPACVFLLPALLVWQPLAPADAGLALLAGGLGVAGHFFLTAGFARATASRLATVEYTTLVWGSLLGYAFFDEVPGLPIYLGSLLIIAGAAMASRH